MADDFYKAKTAEESFKVLGIAPTQDLNEIKKAYRTLAKKYHPDVNPNEKTKFYEVHWAYEMLTNAEFKQKQIKDLNNLNVNIYFSVTFEEGFFGKEFILNMNSNMMKIDGPDGKSSIILESFNFKINPGTSGNKIFKYQDKGARKGSDVGSLFINVSVTPHPNYKIDGSDVYSIVSIPLIKMIKGGKEEVLTLYGIRTVKIPPGTSPGDLLPVKKCGVSQIGNHFFEAQPVFPGEEGIKSDNQWIPLNIDWGSPIKEADEDLIELKKIFEDRNTSK